LKSGSIRWWHASPTVFEDSRRMNSPCFFPVARKVTPVRRRQVQRLPCPAGRENCRGNIFLLTRVWTGVHSGVSGSFMSSSANNGLHSRIASSTIQFIKCRD
jgi:hypothetical protein